MCRVCRVGWRRAGWNVRILWSASNLIQRFRHWPGCNIKPNCTHLQLFWSKPFVICCRGLWLLQRRDVGCITIVAGERLQAAGAGRELRVRLRSDSLSPAGPMTGRQSTRQESMLHHPLPITPHHSTKGQKCFCYPFQNALSLAMPESLSGKERVLVMSHISLIMKELCWENEASSAFLPNTVCCHTHRSLYTEQIWRMMWQIKHQQCSANEPSYNLINRIF